MAVTKIRDKDGVFQSLLSIKGEPGYTPVKGVDYYTPEEIQAVEAAASAAAAQSAQAAETAANRAESYALNPPRVGDNGCWMQWDGAAYVDTGLPAQGETALPVVTAAWPSDNCMVCNVEYRLGTITALQIADFADGKEGYGGVWSVQFTAGSTIAVTVPNTVCWYVAEPAFAPGYVYHLTFIPAGSGYIGVWLEATL